MTDHTEADDSEPVRATDDRPAAEAAPAGWTDGDLAPASELDVHRGRLYGALATAFDRPRAAATDAERDPDPTVLGEVVAEAAAAVAEAGGGSPALSDAADAVVDRLPDDPDALERTFARTFGVETDGAVERYEVSYAPGGVTVNTDRMADAAGFYRAFGLSVGEGSRDRVDAVSVQLEFCSHLAAQRAYLQERGDRTGVERVTDATAAFLEDHVGRWIPRFAAEVRDAVDGGPFPPLADALEAFVDAEADRFGAEPDVFEERPDGPVESLPGVDTDEAGRLDLSCGAGGGTARDAPAGGGATDSGPGANGPGGRPAVGGCGSVGRENFTGSPGQRAATPDPPKSAATADEDGTATGDDAAADDGEPSGTDDGSESETLPTAPPSE